MENAVFLELKRKQNERPWLGIYYYRDYQQREVDFILKEGLEVEQLIQVVSAKMEVKAVVGVNESSDLEGSKRNRQGGNIRSTFSSDMDMRVWGYATAGSSYYRYAAAAV